MAKDANKFCHIGSFAVLARCMPVLESDTVAMLRASTIETNTVVDNAVCLPEAMYGTRRKHRAGWDVLRWIGRAITHLKGRPHQRDQDRANHYGNTSANDGGRQFICVHWIPFSLGLSSGQE
jgi:hypothetical protein